MNRIIILTILLIRSHLSFGQNQPNIVIKDSKTKEPLIGATVAIKGLKIGSTADIEGKVNLKAVPEGEQIVVISFIGYKTSELKITFPLISDLEIHLESNEEELEEVVVSTTRISRNIESIPTRIEAISLEEIDEKANMRPNNVSMILHESTGIQVQQTSYTSANQSIRIQGLDGKYTQILKDGFPTFGGFSSGLSLLDIPPLDLRQVEIIKGSASTLYGGGAIAGVVNFISKEPKEKREFSAIINQTSTGGGTNFSAFSAKRNDKVGYSILVSGTVQKLYDVDKDDFTEIPKSQDLNINPRLFVYFNDKTKLIFGNSTTFQNRFGGDVLVINGKADSQHTYFEKNQSARNISTLQMSRQISESKQVVLKQSLSFFNRQIKIPHYSFRGLQTNAYTDLSYIMQQARHAIVLGGNLIFDNFKEKDSMKPRTESNFIAGAYAQDNWDITDKFLLEGGFRLDYARRHGIFALPRISALYKISGHWSSRLSGGLGYKLPTIFTEATETLAFQNVLAIDSKANAEKSYGSTIDFNYQNAVGENFSFTANQLFFVTQINQPLVLRTNTDNEFYFENAAKPVLSKGFETNLRFTFANWVKFFVGYTFTDAKATYKSTNQTVTLLPKNKVNLALLAEKHQNFKIGLEGYYSDRQVLNNGRLTQPYWEFGLFLEKTFGKFSIFANAENFTDTRQNRFEKVVFDAHNSPKFNEVYTHTEGRSFNGGIKIKL
ncbi:TonB-dependent receptor [Emticicia sp. BO119]|uniref:TonB-dependent receptor n=1 Tax=Emticicia sp. BO119 TaxID=2757768 RepID=UPI0015F01329|nr:TonB-dependent receptor [Emticicia sp. BO119]MBA4849963.1 TonB-dependent receptor [Emticicia sp. BO119]